MNYQLVLTVFGEWIEGEVRFSTSRQAKRLLLLKSQEELIAISIGVLTMEKWY